MSRLSDSRLLVIALLVLVILAAITVALAPPPPAPPLSVRSADRDGALALQLWLERSGYSVREMVALSELDSLNVLFVLEPLWFLYSEEETYAMQAWVESGNTLIIAGTPFGTNALLTPYDLSMSFLPSSREILVPAAPSLTQPPFDEVRAEAVSSVQTERDDVVPHLFSGDLPILVSAQQGTGRLWVSGALRPFTNHGLHDPGSARLIANLLAGVPKNAVIGFDERAHGFGSSSEQSLSGWLFTTAPGWGVLLALVMTMVYFALAGRRFGQAVPLPEERLRRESVEYIVAMATLFRRSGQRSEVLKHYDEQLRRRLSELYAVDSHLERTEFVRTVADRNPAIDGKDLLDLLTRLAPTGNSKEISEAQLVQIATDVDQFLRSIKTR